MLARYAAVRAGRFLSLSTERQPAAGTAQVGGTCGGTLTRAADSLQSVCWCGAGSEQQIEHWCDAQLTSSSKASGTRLRPPFPSPGSQVSLRSPEVTLNGR